jgi:predicted ATPase/class 3 adenylate cyclase
LTDAPSLRMIARVPRDLPTGTVTFLFTDVEGSTRLLHALGSDAYAEALGEHRRILREAFTAHGGVEVDTQGDAFFVAFPTAPGALAAAAEAGERLTGPIRVRIGLHTGTPLLTDEGYVGADVHRAARIAAAGHGGQVLVSSATAPLVDAELTDLGEHRLKDLADPERIFQLGTELHPPLKTLHQTNLPVPASSFVGRERERAEVLDRLRAGSRLLTLTGPGGTGKTRLALEAARELISVKAGGVYWLPLAAVRDPGLVIAEIGRTIGATDDLASHIGDRDLLLLLDNVEQVLDVASDLAALLGTCPNLQLLVTSREPLRIRGEEEYPVPALAEAEAVELFTTRAGMTDPVVAQLCRRLDNLPLAVELAAARATVLTPAQMLERLSRRLDLFRGGRDVDARQTTLRATIEWSHDLLSPDEQRLFARLAVFRGGWTLDSAEEVTDADVDTLGSLLEKSLITRVGDRFRMLETIRAFAIERLEQEVDAGKIYHRHLDHVLRLAEQWYAGRYASESDWLPVVAAEADNVRAALDWADQHENAEAAQLVGAVAPLWSLNAQGREAVTRLRDALNRYPTLDAHRARALTHLGELEDDIPRLEEAIALWRELDEREGEAVALEALGWAHDAHGDMEPAQAAHEQCLELREVIGSPELHGLAARAGLCHVLVVRGETDRAETVARELLAIARRHDAVLMEELALHFLADCSLLNGDYAESERRYRDALALADRAGLLGRATDELIGVAMSLAASGQPERAAPLAAAAHAKQAEIGKTSDEWWRSQQERFLSAADCESSEHGVSFETIVDELLAPEHA